MDVLITGGCGFIGSNFVRYILEQRRDIRILNLDKLTYAGNLANLKDVQRNYPGRYLFIKGDIADQDLVHDLFGKHEIQWVVHFAAESHVDRSVMGPRIFVQTNVVGTFNLLEAARNAWPSGDHGKGKQKRFLHISTDEVYGSLGVRETFHERSPYDPSSPYSASKAASDHMVRAYFRTYGLPTIITHSSNNYGPFQFPEKLIPLMIINGIKGEPLPVYGDGGHVRDWLYVEDHCHALLSVLERGVVGETYHIGGNCEMSNLETVHAICSHLDRKLGPVNNGPRADLIRFVLDRPGHDRRYAMDIRKIRRELGWAPSTSFQEGIERTIDWYLQNLDWVEDILDGSYLEYYRKQYGERLHGAK